MALSAKAEGKNPAGTSKVQRQSPLNPASPDSSEELSAISADVKQNLSAASSGGGQGEENTTLRLQRRYEPQVSSKFHYVRIDVDLSHSLGRQSTFSSCPLENVTRRHSYHNSLLAVRTIGLFWPSVP